jgi:hypothetical protein
VLSDCGAKGHGRVPYPTSSQSPRSSVYTWYKFFFRNQPLQTLGIANETFEENCPGSVQRVITIVADAPASNLEVRRLSFWHLRCPISAVKVGIPGAPSVHVCCHEFNGNSLAEKPQNIAELAVAELAAATATAILANELRQLIIETELRLLGMGRIRPH